MLNTQELDRIINEKFSSITEITFLEDQEQKLLIEYMEAILDTLSIRGRTLALTKLAADLKGYILNYKRTRRD